MKEFLEVYYWCKMECAVSSIPHFFNDVDLLMSHMQIKKTQEKSLKPAGPIICNYEIFTRKIDTLEEVQVEEQYQWGSYPLHCQT